MPRGRFGEHRSIGQDGVVVQREDALPANARNAPSAVRRRRIREIFHLPAESACEPLFRMFEFREFVGGHHAQRSSPALGFGIPTHIGCRTKFPCFDFGVHYLSGEQGHGNQGELKIQKGETGRVLIAPESPPCSRQNRLRSVKKPW